MMKRRSAPPKRWFRFPFQVVLRGFVAISSSILGGSEVGRLRLSGRRFRYHHGRVKAISRPYSTTKGDHNIATMAHSPFPSPVKGFMLSSTRTEEVNSGFPTPAHYISLPATSHNVRENLNVVSKLCPFLRLLPRTCFRHKARSRPWNSTTVLGVPCSSLLVGIREDPRMTNSTQKNTSQPTPTSQLQPPS